ncbi:MAG: TetR/AcrR family transcriptional regulator [Sporichthyaceae bacterium]
MASRSEVRSRMIGAGADLLAERGYAITMLDVIERAQAPRGSIYHHFPNGKAELAVAVAQQMGEEIQHLVAHHAGRIADPEPFLHKLIDHHRRRLVSADYALGCPLMGIVVNGEQTTEIDGAVAETFDVWLGSISVALQDKGIPKPAADQLARSTVTGVEGAIIVSRARHTDVAFDDLKSSISLQVAAL